MHQQKQQKPLLIFCINDDRFFLSKQRKDHPAKQHHQHRKQKYKDGDAVDAMHVFHPLRFFLIGIWFFQI